MGIARLIRAVESFVYPPRCVCCRAFVRRGVYLCDECEPLFARHAGPVTPDGEQPYSFLAAPFRYTKAGRRVLANYKFHGQHAIIGFLAPAVAATVREYGTDGIDCVTWVPLSPLRMRERGYSQSHILAKHVAKALGLPCVRTLVKVRHTKRQSLAKNAGERRANVADAYRVTGGCRSDQSILLIDDVWTTGATMRRCSRLLRDAGAKSVCCAAAFYAGK